MAQLIYPNVDGKLYKVAAHGVTIDIGNTTQVLGIADGLRQRIGAHNVSVSVIRDTRNMQQVAAMQGS